MEKCIDLVLRQCDVDVLCHAAEIAMTPYSPAARHDRFAFQGFEQLIDGPDDSPIAARKILRRKHRPPCLQELLAELELFR